jgi:aspartate kinase
MKVFKFGGASVKSAEAVKNVAKIIQLYPNDKIAIVVSAMGKTTNALEKLNRSIYYNSGDQKETLEEITSYHKEIYLSLFPNSSDFSTEIKEIFNELSALLSTHNEFSFDHLYDQVVSKGEMLSTRIINEYLYSTGSKSIWKDIRECIKTNHQHREGKVNWSLTENLIEDQFKDLFQSSDIILSQGFIAQSPNGFTTTLGREGSDYTASILAYCLHANDLTIWKDVPGVLNADPKWFDNTLKLDNLSYQDAIELAYYGASVIHPKNYSTFTTKEYSFACEVFLKP